MTPEREVEIRADLKRGRLMFPSGDVHELLAEIDRLRELRINSHATYDLVLEKYKDLKEAAKHGED